MNGSEAKVRALEALARLRLSDRESLEELARLYPVAESAGVQTAIAGVLIRADYRTIARPELVQTLREHRLKSGAGAGPDRRPDPPPAGRSRAAEVERAYNLGIARHSALSEGMVAVQY